MQRMRMTEQARDEKKQIAKQDLSMLKKTAGCTKTVEGFKSHDLESGRFKSLAQSRKSRDVYQLN